MVLVVKNPSANAGDIRDVGSIPGLGRSPGEGNGYPLQYSCLENPHGQRSLEGYGPQGHRVRQDRSDLTHTRTHAQNPRWLTDWEEIVIGKTKASD